MDFNTAPDQKSFDLVPAGTVATVQANVRPGQAGDGGWLKRSKNGDCEGLDVEFTVVDGQYAKRKFWAFMIVSGSTTGHEAAAQISGGKIRAILESARNVMPDDKSPDAITKRKIAGWGDLDGMRFVTKIEVEKGTAGFKDKNVLGEVQTPDKKSWTKVEQIAKPAPTAAVPPQAAVGNSIAKPAWAS